MQEKVYVITTHIPIWGGESSLVQLPVVLKHACLMTYFPLSVGPSDVCCLRLPQLCLACEYLQPCPSVLAFLPEATPTLPGL